MVYFKFIEDINLYQPDNSFVVLISKDVNSENGLFKELSRKLNFPDYFGFNWNAVYDCLRDFHWIKEKGIVLIHAEIPHIEEGKLKIYCEILNDAVQDWQRDDEHYLEVIFPKSSEYALVSMLNMWQNKNNI